MSEYPECPFCEHRLIEPVPKTLEGSIKLRCPSCEQRYEYISEIGSFPLEEDLGIEVSEGILGPRVVVGSSDSGDDDVSLSRALLIGGLCCCTIAIIIPVVISLILALF